MDHHTILNTITAAAFCAYLRLTKLAANVRVVVVELQQHQQQHQHLTLYMQGQRLSGASLMELVRLAHISHHHHQQQHGGGGGMCGERIDPRISAEAVVLMEALHASLACAVDAATTAALATLIPLTSDHHFANDVRTRTGPRVMCAAPCASATEKKRQQFFTTPPPHAHEEEEKKGTAHVACWWSSAMGALRRCVSRAAIHTHVAELFGHVGPAEAAAHHVACGLHLHTPPTSSSISALKRNNRCTAQRCLSAVEDLLRDHGGFLLGQVAPTVADCALYAWLTMLHHDQPHTDVLGCRTPTFIAYLHRMERCMCSS